MVRADAEQNGRVFMGIEARAIQSLALFKAERKSEAFGAIAACLRRAERPGATRVFLDEGIDMFQLIRQARSQTALPDFGGIILDIFEQELGFLQNNGDESPPAYLRLSPRELEV